ncbi:uncharacterized protein LOC135837595 [Planococcus citri]|uniref:uncharacterized protein LOC135837595 n=1 Tax=Planococcus citri TaxID=170843 RepID=UPI0031F9C521
MRSVFILVLNILLHCSGCASTKKVIFIYDKVNTTDYDVDWLTGKVQNLSTICSNAGLDYQFESSFPYKSSNFATSQTDSRIEGESTLKNLLQWLKQSPPYSVSYVMTNATTPRDETSVNEILEEIQIKRTEVNFLIGTEYSLKKDTDTDSLNKYGPITYTSNGYIMGPESFQSDKFIESMHLRLTAVSVMIIVQPVALLKDDKTYCIDLQSCSEAAQRAMFDTKLDLNEYELYAKNFNRDEVNLMEWKMSVEYTTESCDYFHKESMPLISGRAVTRGLTSSQFEFDYGFSTKNVRSLSETYRRPINGRWNKIYVSAIDKSFHHEFVNFQMVFLNVSKFERSVKFGEEIPLQPLPGTDLFVGSFCCAPPPSQYFFIKVKIHANQDEYTRLSSTAMTVAEGFGDEHRNPMFERNPGFRTTPACPCSTSKDNERSYIGMLFSNDNILSICIGGLLWLLFCWKFRI